MRMSMNSIFWPFPMLLLNAGFSGSNECWTQRVRVMFDAGKKNKITITNDKGRLSKDEIERMVQVGPQHTQPPPLALTGVRAQGPANLSVVCCSLCHAQFEAQLRRICGALAM